MLGEAGVAAISPDACRDRLMMSESTSNDNEVMHAQTTQYRLLVSSGPTRGAEKRVRVADLLVRPLQPLTVTTNDCGESGALRVRQIDRLCRTEQQVGIRTDSAATCAHAVVAVRFARAAQRRVELTTGRIDDETSQRGQRSEIAADLSTLQRRAYADRFVEQNVEVGDGGLAFALRVLDIIAPPYQVDVARGGRSDDAATDAQPADSLRHHICNPQHAVHNDTTRDDNIHSTRQNLCENTRIRHKRRQQRTALVPDTQRSRRKK